FAFRKSDQIWYTWSANGSTWDPPIKLSGNLSCLTDPTIGVDSQGNLGVAFAPNTLVIHYRYKPYNMPWSSLSPIAGTAGFQPAIVGYRNRMHLVWNEIVIKYLSFPTVSPPLNASFAEWVYYTPPCGANFTGWP